VQSVNILVTREGTAPGADRTPAEKKAALYKGIADLRFGVTCKPREDTTVIFREHEIGRSGPMRAPAGPLPPAKRSGAPGRCLKAVTGVHGNADRIDRAQSAERKWSVCVRR
jgi:4-oxalocrotonate tautomerase